MMNNHAIVDGDRRSSDSGCAAPPDVGPPPGCCPCPAWACPISRRDKVDAEAGPEAGTLMSEADGWARHVPAPNGATVCHCRGRVSGPAAAVRFVGPYAGRRAVDHHGWISMGGVAPVVGSGSQVSWLATVPRGQFAAGSGTQPAVRAGACVWASGAVPVGPGSIHA